MIRICAADAKPIAKILKNSVGEKTEKLLPGIAVAALGADFFEKNATAEKKEKQDYDHCAFFECTF